MHLDRNKVLPLIRRALREDMSDADITTDSFIPRDIKVEAVVVSKSKGVICGIELLEWVFKEVDEGVEVELLKEEGGVILKNQIVAKIKGRGFLILRAERTALNFLCYLSGIATNAFLWRSKLPRRITLLDTRKTRPTLRLLEKYAVRVGGAKNHRFDLASGILIKENHNFIIKRIYKTKDEFRKLIEEAKKRYKKPVQIEAHSFKEFEEYLSLPVDSILLDNLSVPELKRCLALRKRLRPDLEIEVSGGIKPENLLALKRLNIDRISSGSLIHSAGFLDFSLEFVKIL